MIYLDYIITALTMLALGSLTLASMLAGVIIEDYQNARKRKCHTHR